MSLLKNALDALRLFTGAVMAPRVVAMEWRD
jgi:hypothetical protein